MDNDVLRPQLARGRFLLTLLYVYAVVGIAVEVEGRVGCEGPAVAHNGVRGDNDVEVAEARKQPSHQSDEEDER